MEEKLLKVQEVAVLIDCSVQTLNHWYAFKKKCPDNDYSKKLPDFIQEGKRKTRYWRKSDIWKLAEFKTNLPQGRNGILGCVTQKYYRRKKEN